MGEYILLHQSGLSYSSGAYDSQQAILPVDIIVCVSPEFSWSLAEHGLHILYEGVVNHSTIYFCRKYNKNPLMSDESCKIFTQ